MVEVPSGLGLEARGHVLTASRFWFFWFSRERVQETLDTVLLSGDPCQPLLRGVVTGPGLRPAGERSGGHSG